MRYPGSPLDEINVNLRRQDLELEQGSREWLDPVDRRTIEKVPAIDCVNSSRAGHVALVNQLSSDEVPLIATSTSPGDPKYC